MTWNHGVELVKINLLHHIWCFVAPFISLLIVVGCGLPDYAVIEKPIVLNTAVGSSVAFQVPADTTYITGYALYYKVYLDDSDFSEEDDEAAFLESTYSTFNEMQPGSIIPSQRGFIRFGLVDRVTYQTPLITDADPGFSPDLTPGASVIIDFDSIENDGFMDDSSPEPIVIFDDGTSDVRFTLARGIIDPFDSDNTFRSFVADWDWDDGSPADGYHDADLRRRYSTPLSSSPTAVTDYLSSGAPIISTGGTSKLIIGVVAHSYGLDPANLQILTSKPVFLGKVEYQGPIDADRTTH